MSVLLNNQQGITEKTVIIAHSLGGRLLLNYLQSESARKIGAAILLAVPAKKELELWKNLFDPHDFQILYDGGKLLTFYEDATDWSLIRSRAGIFKLVYSEDDKVIPPDHPQKMMRLLGIGEGNLKLVPNGRHLDAQLDRFGGVIEETIMEVVRQIDPSLVIERRHPRMNV